MGRKSVVADNQSYVRIIVAVTKDRKISILKNRWALISTEHFLRSGLDTKTLQRSFQFARMHQKELPVSSYICQKTNTFNLKWARENILSSGPESYLKAKVGKSRTRTYIVIEYGTLRPGPGWRKAWQSGPGLTLNRAWPAGPRGPGPGEPPPAPPRRHPKRAAG